MVWRRVAERAVGPNQWAITARHLCDAAGDEMRAARRPNSNRGGYLQLSVERVGTAVLTAKEVAAIKRGLVGGASKASLARAFGVSWPCIDHIARGDNWNHVTAED